MSYTVGELRERSSKLLSADQVHEGRREKLIARQKNRIAAATAMRCWKNILKGISLF